MTNKEWLNTLDAERFFEMMMWLMKNYGMRFTDTRRAVIAWLDEPNESEEEKDV